MIRFLLSVLLSVCISLPFVSVSFSQNVGNCKPGKNQVMFEGEDFRCRLLNQGDFFWDPEASMAYYEWPKTNTTPKKNLAFAGAIWFGGKDVATHELVLSPQTYRGSIRTYWPGPVNVSNNTLPIPTSNDVCNLWDRVFVVTKAACDSFHTVFDNATGPIFEDQIPVSVRNWPGKGNPYLTSDFGAYGQSLDQDLAPFVDVDGDGIYYPPLGDYPDIGNRLSMAWWVLNDVGNKKNFPSNAILMPGRNLEFQFTASAYPSRPDAYFLKNSFFLNVKLINKGTATLDSCYFGLWSDVDLGYANDDFVQCHVMKNLGFNYNGDNDDEGTSGYGTAPPVFGYKILDGPEARPSDGIDNNRNGTVDEPGEKVLFSGFLNYRVFSPPNADPIFTTDQYYTYLLPKWKDGSSVTHDFKAGLSPVSPLNKPCQFMFDGDSDPVGYGIGGTPQNPMPMPGWTEINAGNAKGDRRFLMSAGPFLLAPGKIQNYTFSTLVGFGGTDNLDNINQLYAVSDSLDLVLPVLNQRPPRLPELSSDYILFPNPSSSDITLYWSASQAAPDRYELLDVRGKAVQNVNLTGTPSTKTCIHLADLQAGLYHVLIHRKDGSAEIRRIVKQ